MKGELGHFRCQYRQLDVRISMFHTQGSNCARLSTGLCDHKPSGRALFNYLCHLVGDAIVKPIPNSEPQPDNIHVIDIWPSRLGSNEGESSVKVPTQLRYTPQGIEWGFQIPHSVERNYWFKLGLEENKESVNWQKSAEELTTGFLNEIYKHIIYTLEQKIGAVVLRAVPIEFCLTVPAIWSEAAKEKTLKACQKAGLKSSEIMLISEPIPAAISVPHELDFTTLKTGDWFVVCDAGGGTVDLISYKIKSLKPIVQVEEVTSGTGGLCGSVFLTRRFNDFITRMLSGEVGWDEEVLSETSDRFDTVIKQQYFPMKDGDEGYPVPVPGLPDNKGLGIRRSKFMIRKEDMRNIFDPVIEKIIWFVQDQIRLSRGEAKTVLLVGGFGQNLYLKQRLRESLPTVQVLQPPNAWIAIVCGAVMMGLSRANSSLHNVKVVSRRARKHYGITLNLEFDPRKHDEIKKYWCPFHKRYQVEVLQWFVRKGDAIQENKAKNIKFHERFPVNQGKPKFYDLTVLADSESSVTPIHICDNVKTLTTLKIDLSPLSESQWKKTIKKGADGVYYYVLVGNIEATFFSALTTYKRGAYMLQ
ncbi:Hsp70 family chaperone, putative [Talaromyces stipitatus ATCC 10500]|uniref:Hsp70 family chaperone, putative n=1 Tax=Talaromyces stipitatus (strain ATCC 10500 / CBS 375.48 / QM 6759 / NRRL 1006) TaxID=441959 RepID=B8MPG3_TALSN|nr:Hsp70 family chaperone, putative [Talaromyces stipitatus ATCC 10500]EED14402.1 Hsp70 family chaperone, putative [Talaromyces stipitatus ATCC 10500]